MPEPNASAAGTPLYWWLRGPATTEIDSPHFRGRRRLNRRVHLILPQNPSTDVNAWEFAGNRCGNRIGIWELDRVSLRPAPSKLRHETVKTWLGWPREGPPLPSVRPRWVSRYCGLYSGRAHVSPEAAGDGGPVRPRHPGCLVQPERAEGPR